MDAGLYYLCSMPHKWSSNLQIQAVCLKCGCIRYKKSGQGGFIINGETVPKAPICAPKPKRGSRTDYNCEIDGCYEPTARLYVRGEQSADPELKWPNTSPFCREIPLCDEHAKNY